MKIKLSQWASENSMTYSGAYKLFKAGKVPNATQLDSGTILVEMPRTVVNIKDNRTSRSFVLQVDIDLTNSGLSSGDVMEIYNDMGKLAEKIAEKLGYDLGEEK